MATVVTTTSASITFNFFSQKVSRYLALTPRSRALFGPGSTWFTRKASHPSYCFRTLLIYDPFYAVGSRSQQINTVMKRGFKGLKYQRGMLGMAMGSTMAGAKTVTASDNDPYFSSVQLLMPMDGADAGTSFPDLSNNTFTFTPTTVTTSTEQIKYGTASAKISGAIDRYLSSTDTIFPTSASSFTIEAWVYILGNAYGGANITAGQATHPIISQSLEGGTGGGVRDQGLGVRYDGSVQFYRGSALGGGSNQSITTAASAVSSSQWVHVACVYDSVAAAISLFVDGTKLVDSTAFTNGGWYDTAQPVYIGHWLVSGYTGYRSSANMHIDDLRVTYAVRYTNSFTPPTQAHPTSA